MRIVVIDDDDALLKLISIMLEEEGYDVLVAQNGKVGMKIVESTPDIDLVITDLIMPEKEGIETIIDLKKGYPNIKILVISGGGIGSNAKTYLTFSSKMGVDSTLSKPFVKQELLESIQKIFVRN